MYAHEVTREDIDWFRGGIPAQDGKDVSKPSSVDLKKFYNFSVKVAQKMEQNVMAPETNGVKASETNSTKHQSCNNKQCKNIVAPESGNPKAIPKAPETNGAKCCCLGDKWSKMLW